MDRLRSLIPVFTGIIGLEPWLKRYRSLKQQLRANPLLEPYVQERHALELTFGAMLEAGEQRGFLTLDDFTDDRYNLVSFLVPIAMIYERLSDTGRKRLAGMLRDGLKTDKGLLPLQNEIETATHLLLQGFDVDFRDIETGGGFDFLAMRGDVELEVECKSASGDLGRKIHRRQMIDLSWHAHPAVMHALGAVDGGRFIRVQVPSRLPADARELDEIAQAIDAALRTGHAAEDPNRCGVSVEAFDLSTTPFRELKPTGTEAEWLRRFVAERTGSPSHHMFLAVRPTRAAILILVESREKDRVLRGLMDDLKAASRTQFTTRRPGILVVQFLELTADDLLDLAAHDSTDPRQASALQIASNVFFDNLDRSHIRTLVYRSHGVVRRSVSIRGDVIEKVLSAQGPTYSFRNPNSPVSGDPRYTVFPNEATASVSR